MLPNPKEDGVEVGALEARASFSALGKNQIGSCAHHLSDYSLPRLSSTKVDNATTTTIHLISRWKSKTTQLTIQPISMMFDPTYYPYVHNSCQANSSCSNCVPKKAMSTTEPPKSQNFSRNTILSYLDLEPGCVEIIRLDNLTKPCGKVMTTEGRGYQA